MRDKEKESVAIKPDRCPFCGHPTEIVEDGKVFYVKCKSDLCELMSPNRDTRENAIKAWNKIKEDK